MSPLDPTNASFVMGFIVLVSSRRETPLQYGEGRNISVTRLRYSTNHNALIAGQSENTLLLRTMSFVKIDMFLKGGALRSNNNVQYVENNVFWTLYHINTLRYTKYTK